MLARLSLVLLILSLGLFSWLEAEQIAQILLKRAPQVVRAVAVPETNEILGDCVYLPSRSLAVTPGGEATVWVERDGVAVAQIVTLGGEIGNLRQVFGLKAGETVILDQKVEAATPVFTQVINQDTTAAAAEAGRSGLPNL